MYVTKRVDNENVHKCWKHKPDVVRMNEQIKLSGGELILHVLNHSWENRKELTVNDRANNNHKSRGTGSEKHKHIDSCHGIERYYRLDSVHDLEKPYRTW